MNPADLPAEPAPSRWQSLLKNSTDPLFLLNRRRRIVFVNRAWETLTGMKLTQIRGLPCRRRPREVLVDPIENLLHLLAPPPEVSENHGSLVRRQLPGQGQAWRIFFMPLRTEKGPPAILGSIEVEPPAPTMRQPLPERIVSLRDRAAAPFEWAHWIGEGPEMQRLRAQVFLAAQTKAPATIFGPRGVGKQWLARLIHQQSPDRLHYFACLDCRRLPSDHVADFLFKSDLVRSVNIGAVYLKEPGRLSREVQSQLCDWLASTEAQERLPRLLLGLTEIPESQKELGLLYELYCRASALVLTVPPLSRRRDEMPRWIERLLPRASLAADKSLRQVSDEAMSHLAMHSWPGNLVELYGVLLNACLRSSGDQIESGDLPFYLRSQPALPETPIPLDKILTEVERRLVKMALRLAGNNKSRAAELLSIWRPRLLRRMEMLGIADAEGEETPP